MSIFWLENGLCYLHVCLPAASNLRKQCADITFTSTATILEGDACQNSSNVVGTIVTASSTSPTTNTTTGETSTPTSAGVSHSTSLMTTGLFTGLGAVIVSLLL